MADDKEFESITCSQLISRMAAKQMRLSRKDVKMAVRYSLEYMSEVLGQGQRIEVRGFGSFSLRFRRPRMTRNPKTREAVFISGRSIPYFKPSAQLGARVNKETKADGRAGRDGRDSPERMDGMDTAMGAGPAAAVNMGGGAGPEAGMDEDGRDKPASPPSWEQGSGRA